jgi:tetratricopeptide (TPR) repeat protein
VSMSQDDIARKTEIDRLMSRANVHRMRGELIEAEDCSRQALELDERRLDAREFVADMLYARGQLDRAAEEYKGLIERRPPDLTLEAKYAKVILEIGEREHEKIIAQEMLANPEQFKTPEKHPLWAFVLSILVPGVGQMYNGEKAKGGIILGIYVLLLTAIAFSSLAVKNLFDNFKAMLVPPKNQPPPIDVVAALFVALLVFLYIYAIIDAPISASKTSKIEKKLAAGTPTKSDEEDDRFRKFLASDKQKENESEPPSSQDRKDS